VQVEVDARLLPRQLGDQVAARVGVELDGGAAGLAVASVAVRRTL
jgi:hypothetical protein